MSAAYHIVVQVSDIKKSKIFYDQMFSQLGWLSHHEDDESKSYSCNGFDYWIVASDAKDPQLAKDLGFNHLAISVASKDEVDVFAQWLASSGGRIDIPAKAYPEYSKNYYAIFFFDPDGTRLEVVSR